MKNPVSKSVQFSVYVISGLVFGFMAFGSLTILQSRWEPVSLFKYVAFFSSVGLVIAGGVVLGSEKLGRILALISILGIGTIYVPATVANVLQLHHGTAVDPIRWIIEAGYFLLLAFTLFFPRRRNRFGNQEAK